MNRPNDYEKVQALGEYVELPAGGYVCRIMSVEETTSQSGRDMLKISLDIAEGDYKNRFAYMYRNDTREEKKWGCVSYQLVYDPFDGKSTNKGFKAFCTAAEESNPGFNIQWGNAFAGCFKNRLIGVIFRREEYLGTDGKLHWSTKPLSFRNVEKIRKGDFKIPEDKHDTANQTPTYGGYPAPSGYSAPTGYTAPPAAKSPAPGLDDFVEIIPDSDLPF